jgi:hypothetical protein
MGPGTADHHGAVAQNVTGNLAKWRDELRLVFLLKAGKKPPGCFPKEAE